MIVLFLVTSGSRFLQKCTLATVRMNQRNSRDKINLRQRKMNALKTSELSDTWHSLAGVS